MAWLYMYDVRGIQDYVFRTNKMKEIIGASLLVEDLVSLKNGNRSFCL